MAPKRRARRPPAGGAGVASPLPRPLAARDRGARPARDSDGVRRARRGALVVGRVVAVRLRLRRLRRRRGRPRARDGVGAGGAVGCVRARVRVSARDGYLERAAFRRARLATRVPGRLGSHRYPSTTNERFARHPIAGFGTAAAERDDRLRERDVATLLFASRSKRRYGTGRRAHTRGELERFRGFSSQKSRRLVRAVEPRSIPNLDLVRPEFVARGVRAPGPRAFLHRRTQS